MGGMNQRVKRIYVLLQVSLFIVVFGVIGYELKLLQTERMIRDIKIKGIDYEAFRSMQLEEKALNKVNQGIGKLIKKHPELKDYPCLDSIGYLTFSMLINNFELANSPVPDGETFLRGIGRIAGTPAFQELYVYYKAILADLKYFPVPRVQTGEADISYENSWFVLRSYGGKRRHEGTDLMASNNLRGYFPIISMTDGTIEKKGWLDKGGYRIGIRSTSGGYFYYAHLNSYAPGLKKGDKVIAGQLLGFMGDSGYGEEGTIGKFDVHLHMGIYVSGNSGDISVNPYQILKILETKRTVYERQMK